VLNIRTQQLGNATILHCVGQLVFPETVSLQTLTMHEPHARERLVIDLSNVTAIDAAGLRALVSLRSWSERTGRTLKLMNVNPKVENVLELTHLKPAFEVCSAREMLDLLCRAIHQTQREVLAPTLREVAFAAQSLSLA
jgi:anti-anti-sigma factor